jgi:hypothetical protein
MERELRDVPTLSEKDIEKMEEKRLDELNKAGIEEEKVLQEAEESDNNWTSYFQENITRGKDDVNFTIRDQWTAVERSEGTRLFKPMMTFNVLYDPVNKILAEQRKNKPDLMVRSINGVASQDQINLRTDLLRTIAYNSQTDIVYQTAARNALMLGFGAFQITMDYENPRSCMKIPRYVLINDPTTCSWDPSAIQPHKGDGNFCSRKYILTRDEFFATYPYVTNPISYLDPYMLLDTDWQTRNTIVVCDRFVKEWYPLKVYRLSNGRTVDEQQWEKMQKAHKIQKEITGDSVAREIIEKEFPRITMERQTQDYRIMHYRLLRNQIIDFSVWQSKQLPIPFVDGNSQYIDGRQYTKSFIRDARDAQKSLNYIYSEIIADIKNRRREQWIGTPDNIIGNEQMWRNPELQNGILIAKPDPKTGMMPQKTTPWDMSPALMQSAQAAKQTVREILGYSEREALEGRDMSGKARRERKMEGAMASYVFNDNLNQAIEQGGRITLDLLKYAIGDDERPMVISKADGKKDHIILNRKMPDGRIENALDDGEYDIEIDTGPSFSVQKDMALEFFQQTIAASGDPMIFKLIADLWAKNLDIQYMPQIAERFKTLVPPQILAKEEGKEPPPPKPSPQEQLMQMEMKFKQAELAEKAADLKIRHESHELEKARLILEAKKLEQDMKETMIKSNTEMDKANLNFSAQIAKVLADAHQ